MAKRRVISEDDPKPQQLEGLVTQVLHVARKAKRHKQSLGGSNFYAGKLIALRADATNIFRDLSSNTPGDISAMAELIEQVFGPATTSKRRNEAAKELIFALRTTWREPQPHEQGKRVEGVFPLTVLDKAKRGYLVTIGRQMNGSYSAGWYDSCAVMMRRLLEVVIIEAFEDRSIADKIKKRDGNYIDLSDMIERALSENTWHLSRNTRKFLPKLRDIGHMSAHGRYYTATQNDIDEIRQGCRVVIEEFLHHARFL